jgi:hypothetical protein
MIGRRLYPVVTTPPNPQTPHFCYHSRNVLSLFVHVELYVHVHVQSPRLVRVPQSLVPSFLEAIHTYVVYQLTQSNHPYSESMSDFVMHGFNSNRM